MLLNEVIDFCFLGNCAIVVGRESLVERVIERKVEVLADWPASSQVLLLACTEIRELFVDRLR